MRILELVFISVIVLVAEVLVFMGFERRTELKRGDDTEEIKDHGTSGDVRFWQNIITYDHRKGGDKE